MLVGGKTSHVRLRTGSVTDRSVHSFVVIWFRFVVGVYDGLVKETLVDGRVIIQCWLDTGGG